MTALLPDPAPRADAPDHDQEVRTQFARELAVLLDEHGQDYAAHLVRAAPTDGQWP